MEYDSRLRFKPCENTIEDMKRIFVWSNDEEVRKNSFSTNKITWEDHQKWFNNKINSEDYRILFFMDEDKYVGMVRLSVEEDFATISYLISKDFRGKGYGKIMLKFLKRYVKENNIAKHLIAEVKHSNVASKQIFEKLGYDKKDEEELILYSKIEL